LNAAQDSAEADIIAAAGEPGRVTVATNMAGRGTDIALHAQVERNGGLHVISTERHHAGRIDRQLFGRCARQGDPGTVELILCWEDELLAEYYPAFVRRRLMPGCRVGSPAAGWLVDLIATVPQRSAERHHGRMRRDLLKLDEQLARTLAFGGRPE
jgi:preprotein translocase subunit SecA